jgi:tetratricopeptide (TPR) repeat protein
MNANFQRGVLLYQQDRHEQAEAEFRQVLSTDPGDSMAHSFLALCLTARKDFKQATEEAQVAVHHAPDSDFAHYALAKVFFDRNRNAEALEHINEAIRLDSWDADYFAMLGSIHLEERRWPAALESVERGLQIDPEHVGCNNLRAVALVKLGRRTEAGATIDGSLAKDPDNAITHANKGWALLHDARHKEALEHFREALRLDPNNEWAREGIIEALKAHYRIYSWMLRYFLWMSRLSSRAQWGVILGAYFGNRLLGSLARNNPDLAPWIWPIRILYIIFVLLTWTASPLFDLALRLNRFGRMALSRDQTVASNFLGATILISLSSLAAWLITGREKWSILAIVFGLLIVPVSAIFRCHTGWPRLTMAIFTVVLLGLGLPTVFGQSGLFLFFLIGVILSPWLANFLITRRPQY